MQLDIHQLYFMMSFRFNRTKPEEFGLVRAPGYLDLFTLPSDNSAWQARRLYDLGWGDEIGFVRLPELDCDDLWYLLMNSPLQENMYGAANELLRKYPETTLEKIEQFLLQADLNKLDKQQKRALVALQLEQPMNRCQTQGKSPEQVNRDYARWKAISQTVSALSLK